jgi:hypothetical protein
LRIFFKFISKQPGVNFRWNKFNIILFFINILWAK